MPYVEKNTATSSNDRTGFIEATYKWIDHLLGVEDCSASSGKYRLILEVSFTAYQTSRSF